MATTDPLITKINHETDLRFWAAHPEKSGQALAKNDPLVSAWLAINYQVKQAVHDGSIHWSGDPAPAAVLDPTTHPANQTTPHPAAAPPEIEMPDDYVGRGGNPGGNPAQPAGGVTSPAQVATASPPEIQMPDDYVGKAPAPISVPPHVATTGGHSHAAHPTAPPTRPAIDPVSQAQLYTEANARFWAQTGYKPGQKLDASKPADKAMMPVWSDVYKKVEAQWRAGTLQLTHDHPAVVAGLTDAAHHTADAAAYANAAAQAAAAGDHASATQHMDDAHASHGHANAAAAGAAVVQPPTVSPELANHAAHQIQSFVMNGAGQGVPTGPARSLDGDDVVAAMQGASAPAQASAGAAQVPASQTAPAGDAGIPTFPPSSTDHDSKHGDGAKRGRVAMGFGIAAAGLATIGLTAFAVRGHGTVGHHRRHHRR